MRRILRIFIIIVVLSLLVSGGIFYAQYQNAQTAAQGTVVKIEDETIVVKSDLTVTVNATGSITPQQQLPLAFDISAPVKQIFIKEGQSVKKGDVLARLDAPELENAVANAQLALAAQQAAYDALTRPARDVDIAVAEAALRAAQAQAGSAALGADPNQVKIAELQAEISRNQLWQAQLQRDIPSAVAKQTAEQASALGFSVNIPQSNPADNVTAPIIQAENGVALADLSVSGAENKPADIAALSSANAQVVAAQRQLDLLRNGPTELQLKIAQTQMQLAQLAVKQAQAALTRAELVAPFDGLVAQNNLVVGEVPPQGAAMSLINSSSFYVDVAVDETDIVNVQTGQSVSLRLDALPDTKISAHVTRVAITPIRAGQLVTYTVRVTLDAATVPIRVGMTTTATIIVNQLNDVIALPNRFVRIDSVTQQAYVTVQQSETKFTDIPVTLGVRNETESQIISGLETGQKVVLVPRATFNPIDN
ncbi:MAG: HlyD family efflux transporter periplasmic adaptor subunit [Anaerolineaceae bacterium]|nr:HlyD family efflux transporter periplasmic adaptor subunit [Anaerolineaceae bacterium]